MSSSQEELNVWAQLAKSGQEHGERTAWWEFGKAVTYRQFVGRATALAQSLRDLGLNPGERVSILANNQPNYIASYFASAGAGLILNPLNVRLALPELCEIVADSESRVLLADEAHRELAQELEAATDLSRIVWIDANLPDGVTLEEWSEVETADFEPSPGEPDDPVQLYYTSGTTGHPKGVILTHRNVTRHAQNAVRELDLEATDIWGHFAPLFHLADAWASFAITMVGGSHSFVPGFEADAVLDEMSARGVTITNLVPTMIVRLLARQEVNARELPKLRLLLSGGAPMAPILIDRIGELIGCDYAQTYGLTETSPYLTVSRLGSDSDRLSPEERREQVARTGRAFGGVTLEVVRESGTQVRRDDCEVGEVRVRGESISPGYWNKPEETARAHRGGWFYTGDLAVMNELGSINIVDRKKDVILSGGETIYSTEIENALFEHADVAEVAVFGVPDEEWGELVAAAIVSRPGHALDVSELQAFCRDRLAGFKVPRIIRFLEDLPRTGSGKIRKQSLRVKRTRSNRSVGDGNQSGA